ncbi:hypothetical protein [Sulfitobacter geojensis]|uniref:hypothetical protein n=1 Tax=Sulfitobacter geojensis TaxID=1342299 RepID=UPI003B8E6594
MDGVVAFGGSVAEPSDRLSPYQYMSREEDNCRLRFSTSRSWKLANLLIGASTWLYAGTGTEKNQKICK